MWVIERILYFLHCLEKKMARIAEDGGPDGACYNRPAFDALVTGRGVCQKKKRSRLSARSERRIARRPATAVAIR